jgi:hypothetical protein
MSKREGAKTAPVAEVSGLIAASMKEQELREGSRSTPVKNRLEEQVLKGDRTVVDANNELKKSLLREKLNQLDPEDQVGYEAAKMKLEAAAEQPTYYSPAVERRAKQVSKFREDIANDPERNANLIVELREKMHLLPPVDQQRWKKFLADTNESNVGRPLNPDRVVTREFTSAELMGLRMLLQDLRIQTVLDRRLGFESQVKDSSAQISKEWDERLATAKQRYQTGNMTEDERRALRQMQEQRFIKKKAGLDSIQPEAEVKFSKIVDVDHEIAVASKHIEEALEGPYTHEAVMDLLVELARLLREHDRLVSERENSLTKRAGKFIKDLVGFGKG